MPSLLLDKPTVVRLDAAELTHASGVQADLAPPEGYWRWEVSRTLGTGDAAFTEARDSLFSWRMHERAGIRVQPSGPEILVGSVLGIT